MAAFCSRLPPLLEPTLFLKFIRCIPTAAELSPIAAITAQCVTPADRLVPEILSLHRVMVPQTSVWQDSHRPALRKCRSLLPPENMPEKSPRLALVIGSSRGARTRKRSFSSCFGLRVLRLCVRP